MADPRTVVEMFERRVSANGAEPFLIGPSGPTLTFADANRLAGSVVARLKAVPRPRDSVVALYLSNRPHWVIASLAAWSMGATVAAINRLMPVSAAAELLSISQATTACVEDGDEAQLLVPSVAVSVDTTGVVPLASDARWTAGADPGRDAAILFTSGTTGRPKGFVSTHQRIVEDGRNLAASYSNVPSFRESMAPARVAPVVSFTAYGHIAAYGSLAFALWSGRRLALIPKFTVEAVRDLLAEYHLSALRLNPAALHMLATTPLELDMSGVRYVFSGTAPLPQKTRELFSTRFGVPILQGYGQSETGPISLSRYEDVVSGREPAGSVGAVLDRVELRIADSDDRPLPSGTEGEIQVRSEQTATPLAESSLSISADGFVRTGDIGMVDPDGYLSITGRIVDKLVVGGFNVFPAEVEEALRQCEHITDVVVVGLPDLRLGERPVAGVVWAGEPRPDDAEAVARDLLAAYKVPRQWLSLKAVPLTDRGKVDRRAATDLAVQHLGGIGE
jgi:acyl-CoA synthetase (AMP-forming)/AMP-acid ligase II